MKGDFICDDMMGLAIKIAHEQRQISANISKSQMKIARRFSGARIQLGRFFWVEILAVVGPTYLIRPLPWWECAYYTCVDWMAKWDAKFATRYGYE